MSWVDKEVSRRAATAAQASAALAKSQAGTEAQSESAQMALLWERLQTANNALPAELKLQLEADKPSGLVPAATEFLIWLRAPNGAGLGWTGIAIRYIWPEKNQRKSYNFWIRWKAGVGYVVSQRIRSSGGVPIMDDFKFNELALDRMVKYLVTGARIKLKHVRKKRFWIF